MQQHFISVSNNKELQYTKHAAQFCRTSLFPLKYQTILLENRQEVKKHQSLNYFFKGALNQFYTLSSVDTKLAVQPGQTVVQYNLFLLRDLSKAWKNNPDDVISNHEHHNERCY